MRKKISHHITIYYFSGTGNALNVARWMQETGKRHDKKVELLDISKLKSRRSIHFPESSMVGFISPTHGFNFPPIMFHFLLRFPKAKKQKVFIINTRAGMKAGKLFIPGLSGMAQYLSAKILRVKGYKVIGMRSIDLPSNWISLHPGIRKKVVDSLFTRRKKDTEQFALRIFGGEKVYRALFDIIQDLLITPVGVLYYLFGRFMLAKTFIASHKCNHCNRCIKECPVQAIKNIDNRPFWTYRCESCMHCMNICPQRAIETAHGFITAIIVLVNMVILYHLYRVFPLEEKLLYVVPGFICEIIVTLFWNLIFFSLLFPAYRWIHYLLRFRIFEKLVVYTSLTSYKFWRRYKPYKMYKDGSKKR